MIPVIVENFILDIDALCLIESGVGLHVWLM